jgi:hypothetical protein
VPARRAELKYQLTPKTIERSYTGGCNAGAVDAPVAPMPEEVKYAFDHVEA